MSQENQIAESDASFAAGKEKEKEKRLTSKDQQTLLKLRAMMSKEKKPVKEETINELKNSTLDAYKQKANKSADDLTAQGKHGEALKRRGNVMKATGKQIDKTSANIGRALRGEPVKEEVVTEGKSLQKKVKVVKGVHAGKHGWIREIKHGLYKGAPKSYHVDLDDGGQANNLPGTALRLVHKEEVELDEGRMAELHASISDHMDKHIDHYKKTGGAEHLMHKADQAAHKISVEHGISHDDAYKHISDHIENRLTEEVAANSVAGDGVDMNPNGKKTVMTKEPLKRKKLEDFKEYVELEEAGLWDNIHAKRKRIKNGSGERMRKPGSKGAPTDADFKAASESVEHLDEYAIDAKGHKSSTGGLTQKGRDAYNAKGGNLKAPVTTPPSKLDPDSKAAKRRKSFCARMSGVDGPMKDEKGRPTRKALALRKWNC